MARIGIDVDETVVSVMGLWLEYLNRIAGTKRTFDDCHWDYDLGKHFPELQKLGIDPMSFWDCDNLYEQLQPKFGVVEAIQRLKDVGHNIIFISHTKRMHFSSKVRFIKRHFPFVGLNDLHSGDGFVATHEKSVMQSLDVFIDDRLKYFPHFGKETLKIHLMTPYTQDFSGEISLDLVTDRWDDIVNFLEDTL